MGKRLCGYCTVVERARGWAPKALADLLDFNYLYKFSLEGHVFERQRQAAFGGVGRVRARLKWRGDVIVNECV